MALDLLGGVLIAAPIALGAWKFRAVTGAGALSGFVCAVAIYLGAYLAGIAVLGTAFLLTIVATRIGRERKAALGIAEENRGRRGAASVLANCGVAALAGLTAAFSNDWSVESGAILLVAALAAGASDSVASEVGKAVGGRPRAFPMMHPAAPGTPGAVTVVGTIAGVLASIVIAWPAVTLWLLPARCVAAIAIGCCAGACLESTLATAFERRGLIGNHTLNVVNTAVAAGVALLVARQLGPG